MKNMGNHDLEQIKTIVSEAVEDGNEKLAQTVVKGFANTATKQDIKGLDDHLTGVEGSLTGVEEKLTTVDERLAIVEHKLDKALYREFQRIDTDTLEKDMKLVKQKLGLAG